jgi:hypothetical protein
MNRDEDYWLRAENTILQAQVEGLQYELHQRDLRLAEQNRYIAELKQRIEELKRQAVPDSKAPALPAFVKANVRKRKPKKPGTTSPAILLASLPYSYIRGVTPHCRMRRGKRERASVLVEASRLGEPSVSNLSLR